MFAQFPIYGSSRRRVFGVLLAALLFGVAAAQADPQITSWYTRQSSKYARIVETDAELASNATETTWSRNNGQTTLTQSLPAYAGPQEVDYSANWVYLTTPDLATYLMGPWYNDSTRTTLFVNLPVNQKFLVRFPRTSTLGAIPSAKTPTAGYTVNGVLQQAIGFYVDGVGVFDPTDGFSYYNGTEVNGGQGQWHRDAYVNEGPTFDVSDAHQQNTGTYHNHCNPLALRSQLGDNVTYNSTTGKYAEGNTATPTAHSPIVGWMFDGLPIYGPYGYSSALDATSGVRRMVGGLVIRDGTTTGVDNITTAGRTLPAWALRNNGNISASGPAVSSTYPLGRYIEDWAYLGDLVKSGSTYYTQGVDYDLNEFNVRYCVTPEFPNGTYAYFVNISSAGVPQCPYITNRFFYGTPTGSSVTSITETVTNQFKGGPNLVETASMGGVNTGTGAVVLTWTSVEGGTYTVQATPDLKNWSNLSTTQAAASAATTTSFTESGGGFYSERFYRVSRNALAQYDGGGPITYAPPTATTTSASNVGSVSATLNGSVNANGLSTTVIFNYGPTAAYGSTVTATQSPISAGTATSVSAAITGLSASTPYHYQVVATNSYGTSYGSDMTLTTSAAGTPPFVTTTAATNIASTTGTLNGTVNANNSTASVSFEYGLTTSYGNSITASPSSVSGSSSTSVAAVLIGLTPATIYHYRVDATSGNGAGTGGDLTFTTGSASSEGLSNVTPNTGSHGTTVTLAITLNSAYTSPPPPPATAQPTGATLTLSGATTINATSYSRNTTTGVVTAVFTLPSGATLGAYNVNVVFGPNTWSLTDGFKVY